jgi:AcrR family transcriptional regulator
MVAARTLRERLRTEMAHEIKAAASRQLAEYGAAALSLRAVARELGLASSAVYRYFKSRDELLTQLIIDAYDSLGQAAEDAEERLDRQDLFGRWSATCYAVRGWALEHPHEYALIYGSPVPGYRAPQATVGPASRVTSLLARIVQDGVREGQLSLSGQSPADARAAAAVAPIGQSVLFGVPAPLVLAGLIAWLEIFGAVSFELFGQLNNVVSDQDAFFEHVVRAMAALLGLEVPRGPRSAGRRPSRGGARTRA